MAEDEDLFTRIADLTADLREASGARSGELDRLRKHLAAADGALADPSLPRMTLGVLIAAAGTTRFEVPAGSVWLLCRLFDPSAPENGFAGLRIEHGEMSCACGLLPEPDGAFDDPLGKHLGEVRVLRTSPLTPVPQICVDA